MKENYGKEYNDSFPGDIVMATAATLSHPAFIQGIVGRNFLVFGAVRGYVYRNWHTDHKNKYYDGVVHNQERLIVDWMKVDGNYWEFVNPPSYYCKVAA